MKTEKVLKICYLVNRVTNTSVPGKLSGQYANVKIFVTDSVFDVIWNYKKYSIINTHHTRTALFVSLLYLLNFLSKQKFFVHTVHRDLSKLNCVKRLFYQFFILNFRDNIICNSYSTYRSIKGITNTSASIIYNGIDSQLFYPSGDNEKLDEVTVLITVSRLIQSKRIDILMNAVSELTKLGHHIHLKILGHGPEMVKLKALKHSLRLENIEFLGEVPHDQVADSLRSADIYVTCSETEGFGNSTIEAYFCGLTIVATDIEVHREIGGNEFIFFNRNSTDSLVRALEKCISRERKIRFENKLSKFDLTETTKELVKFYNEQNNPKI